MLSLTPASCARADVDILVVEWAGPMRDRLEHGCRRVVCPILFLVAEEHLAEILPLIRDKDDICLDSAPPELVTHRIDKLVRSIDHALDPLTGVGDRTRLITLTERLAAAADVDNPVSILLCDLDHFKAINDEHGHRAGDDVLRSTGQLLSEYCGREHVAARYGGEEFAILIAGSEAAALEHAEAIRARIGRLRFAAGLNVTASLGVATIWEPGSAETLLAQAEEALFAAKADGRDLTCHHRSLRNATLRNGEDLSVLGLEHRARVLSERVTNYIAQRSRKIIQKVRHEADTDGLTGCYSRRYLDRRLHAEFESARQAEPLCVALLDVDYFGQINKEHGWPTGDRVLRELCDLLRGQIRQADWLGRYGGEEFCVVMPATRLVDAGAVLQRMRQAVARQTFTTTSGRPLRLTISIGVVEQRSDDATPAEVLERASQQALAAKQAGRNRLHGVDA